MAAVIVLGGQSRFCHSLPDGGRSAVRAQACLVHNDRGVKSSWRQRSGLTGATLYRDRVWQVSMVTVIEFSECHSAQ